MMCEALAMFSFVGSMPVELSSHTKERGKPRGEVSAPQARTFPRRFTEAPIQKPKVGGPRSAMSRDGLPAQKVAI
jgi:hypothetical protein